MGDVRPIVLMAARAILLLGAVAFFAAPTAAAEDIEPLHRPSISPEEQPTSPPPDIVPPYVEPPYVEPPSVEPPNVEPPEAEPYSVSALDPPENPPPGDAPRSLEAGGIGVLALGGMVIADVSLGAGPGSDLPDPLTDVDVELRGQGWTLGGGFRASYQLDAGFRFGAAMAGLHLGGLELRHTPLAEGVSIDLDRASAFDLDLFIGQAFDAGGVAPYIDAVMSLDVVSAEVSVTVNGLGHVGDTTLMGVAFGVTPRIGVFIPVDRDFYLDIGMHGSPIGLETLGGYVAFGTWDNY
jgi:hypothetical protein